LTPEWFARSGPGTAADGGLRFNLSAFNEAYFSRLRERVLSARDRGIYVSVMLFNGWSIEQKGGGSNPWLNHPFNIRNNVSGIDGDPNGDERGLETHTLQIPAVTRLQEEYVRKVVDTVNDVDNVLYEVSNESDVESREWQYHIVNYIKSYEATKSVQHPVGMTAQYPGASNGTLFSSPADWISPNEGRESDDYQFDPPSATGSKVILSDTDHLWGIGGTSAWAWRSFTRGLNVTYMDPWEGRFIPATANEDLRRNLGYILYYANRLPLATMEPVPRLASTGYCLAHVGSVYLAYLPGADEWLPIRGIRRLASWFISSHVELDLSSAEGVFTVEWLNPRMGEITQAGTITGGRRQRFTAPFAGAAVLYLAKQE